MPNASASIRLLLSAALCCALSCSKSQSPTSFMRSSEINSSGPIQFTKTSIEVIPGRFRSEGVTAFDVNNTGTGQLDIVTRQYWYPYPPDVSTRHRISPPTDYAFTDYSDSYANWGGDVDGDGFTDLIVLPRQNGAQGTFRWYQNPAGEDRDWNAYLIIPPGEVTRGERPVYEDLFGDGNRKELVFTLGSTNTLVWAVPGDDPTQPWVTTAISEAGSPDVGTDHHGMGVGDINGDGRIDIIVATGWYEGPADRFQSPWVFHRENWLPAFCYTNPPMDPESCCSDMFATDVNGDGLVDILCSRPHNRGRWWIEQLADGGWSAHPMDPEAFTSTTPYSESHAARFEDLDGDGLKEFITGKRKWAHGTGGEGASEPGVLVYYKLRSDGSALWDRYDIDLEQASGVGTQFEVMDINGDGFLDVIISNKLGLFYFEQIPPQ